MTSESAAVVEKFLGAFAAGDVETALSCFSDETVVEEAHGLPFSGTFVGPGGFMELLGAMSAVFVPRVDKVEVLDAGTAAVGRIDLTFRSKKSGRELATSAVEVYRVSDGKITHADVYYKDPAAVSALAEG
jgi:ketosteroid isomerase-like protein